MGCFSLYNLGLVLKVPFWLDKHNKKIKFNHWIEYMLFYRENLTFHYVNSKYVFSRWAKKPKTLLVPDNKKLFSRRVLDNKKLFSRWVLNNKKLYSETLPDNNLFQILKPYSEILIVMQLLSYYHKDNKSEQETLHSLILINSEFNSTQLSVEW